MTLYVALANSALPAGDPEFQAFLAGRWWAQPLFDLQSVSETRVVATSVSFGGTELSTSVRLTGTDFAFAGAAPTAGTITMIEWMDVDGVTVLARITPTTPISLVAFAGATQPMRETLLFGGNDTLVGSAFDDVLIGGAGDDSIFGGGGQDHMVMGSAFTFGAFGPEEDTVDGGAGIDTVVLDLRQLTVGVEFAVGSMATATGVTLGTGAIIRNVEAIDIRGGTGNDTFTGGDANDTLNGNGGNDLLSGGNGNDRFGGPDLGFEELQSDTLDGGAGQDEAYISVADRTTALMVDFTNANTATGVTLGTATGVSTIRNIEDINFISGSANDTILGSGGSDTIDGGGGSDFIHGGDGDDYLGTVFGPQTPGAETIDGGNGTDWAVIDLVTAGTYAFASVGTAIGQTINAGNGSSYLLRNIENLEVRLVGNGIYNLTLTNGDDWVFAGSFLGGSGSRANADGGAGNDELYGGFLADTLLGGTGNDSLFGGDGADSLFGGADADGLYATLGDSTQADTLDGGTGDDTAYLRFDPTVSVVTTNFEAISTATGVSIVSGSGTNIIRNVERVNVVLTLGDDEVIATAGADTLDGREGNDSLQGGAGADIIVGGEGDDTLFGGSGLDSISGGAGFDIADFSTDAAGGGAGAIVVNLTTGYVIDGFGNFEQIVGIEGAVGSSGADNIVGDASANVLSGEDGNDQISGWGGTDNLVGGGGNDSLDGGADNDEVTGGSGADTLIGGAGRDWLFYSSSSTTVVVELWRADAVTGILFATDGEGSFDQISGFEVVSGGLAGDLLSGDSANNTLLGGEGGDTLNGGYGDDSIDGGRGNDYLFGSVGADRIDGREGDDTVFGDDAGGADADSADFITGEAGADFLIGEGGNDTLFGGGNNDFLVGGYFGTLVSGDDSINGDGGDDTLLGEDGNDTLNGGINNDFLIGGAGNDSILGGDGDDFIVADGFGTETGNDTVSGGIGNDTILGGAGDDSLTGGVGSDLFWVSLSTGLSSGTDTVSDYDLANDAIIIDAVNPAALTFAALQGLMTQTGANVTIDFASLGHAGTSLIILNVTTAQLQANDFIVF